jgi:hypothetical protein
MIPVLDPIRPKRPPLAPVKHAAFLLSYGVPPTLLLVLFDGAQGGSAFRSPFVLVLALMLGMLAAFGLDLIGIRGRYEGMRTAEAALRGALAGLAFLGTCGLALWLARAGAISFKVAFWSAGLAGAALAPIALVWPARRKPPRASPSE